ncbi:UNVERIFIED_CONTAM: hypothetical protein HHA_247440 [Hammondia hammondi]|eukprot:XP_008883783.1 hypothetical protein HHA_247440 [Hammondia hammondi]
MRHQERFDLRTGVFFCIGLAAWSVPVVQHCASSDGVFSAQAPSAPQHDIWWDAKKAQDELRAFGRESWGELAKGAESRATEGGVLAATQAAGGVLSAAIPAAEGAVAAATPTAEDEVAAAIPAVEGEVAAAIPAVEGEVAAAIPAAEGAVAAAIPAVEGEVAAAIPAVEGEVAAAIPAVEGEVAAAIPAAEDEAVVEISDAVGDVAVTSPAAEEEQLAARSFRPSGMRTSLEGVPSTRGLVFTGGGSILAAAFLVLLSRLSRRRSHRAWTVAREERQSLRFSVASDALLVISALVALLGAKRVVKGVMRKREAKRRKRGDDIPRVEMPVKGKRRRSEAKAAWATEGVAVSELVEDETDSHVTAPTEPGRTAMAATAVSAAVALAGSVALALGSRRWFRYYRQVEEESRRLVAAGALFAGALFAAYKLFKQVRAKLAARRKKTKA